MVLSLRFIHPKNLAEKSDDDVLGNIQAYDSPERSKPEQPNIQGNTGDQCQ